MQADAETPPEPGSLLPVDAVVAWVDGSDPAHRAKREQRLAELTGEKIHRTANVAHRFEDHDEIRYCLRSIRHHAPWVRTIWLVTDQQFPPTIDRALAEEADIRVVDHKVLFRGYESALPTFNSQSIETVLWRIPGVAPRILYFNDDMFLTRSVKPEDFFTDDGVVMRGHWKGMGKGPRHTLHAQAKVNGARMMGFEDRFFSVKHVIYPLLRDAFAELFAEFPEEMERNLGYPFRTVEQFWPVSLHHHYLVREGRSVTAPAKRVVHFPINGTKRGKPEYLRRKFARMAKRTTFAACLNELPGIEAKVPDAMLYLDVLTGPPAAFELPRAENDETRAARARARHAMPLPRPDSELRPVSPVGVFDLVRGRGTAVQRRIARTGLRGYERFTQAALLALTDTMPGTVNFWDAGAHVGLYPVLLTKVFGEDAVKAVAIEPAPKTLRKARRVRRRNGLSYRIVTAALSDQDGEAALHLSAKAETSHSLRDGFRRSVATAQVPTRSIDSLVSEGLPPPNLLKIDVATWEPEVIEGARATIAAHRPVIVCEMLGTRPDAAAEMLRWLAELGYRFLRIGPVYPFAESDAATAAADTGGDVKEWLFVPGDLPAAFEDRFNTWLKAIARCGPR